MRTLAVLAALSLVTATGCWSKYKPRTATWGQVDDDTRGSVQERKDAADTEKLTAAELASRFNTSAECEYEARVQYGKSPQRGLALLAACLKRSDFIVLDVFWNEPWAKLFKDPNRFVEITRVIGNRGGSVETDLATLQQNRLPVYSVEQAVENPKQTKGRFVLARALYKGTDKENPALRVYDQTAVDVEAANEQATGDGRLPSVGAPTGVMLLVEPKRGEDTPGLEEEYLIMGELVSADERSDDETGEARQVLTVKTLVRMKPYAYLR